MLTCPNLAVNPGSASFRLGRLIRMGPKRHGSRRRINRRPASREGVVEAPMRPYSEDQEENDHARLRCDQTSCPVSECRCAQQNVVGFVNRYEGPHCDL